MEPQRLSAGYAPKRVRIMEAEEAAKFTAKMQVFLASPVEMNREQLLYLLDNLNTYFKNNYCKEWSFWQYRRKLQAEWVRRLNAGEE